VGREKALLIAADGEKCSPEEIEEGIMNTSGLIDQVMLYNNQRKYTAALVCLDTGKVEELIKKENIKDADDLLGRIRDSLFTFREDPSYKNKFQPQWQPHTFQILPEPFSVENQMINSSMKMVRFKITQAYEDLIEYMYSEEGSSYTNDKNREVLKKLFSL